MAAEKSALYKKSLKQTLDNRDLAVWLRDLEDKIASKDKTTAVAAGPA